MTQLIGLARVTAWGDFLARHGKPIAPDFVDRMYVANKGVYMLRMKWWCLLRENAEKAANDAYDVFSQYPQTQDIDVRVYETKSPAFADAGPLHQRFNAKCTIPLVEPYELVFPIAPLAAFNDALR